MSSENVTPWYRDIELLRAYMRALIVLLFMWGVGYVLTGYISVGPSDIARVIDNMQYLNQGERNMAFKLMESATASQIPASTVWSWFTGVVTGTLITYYFSEKISLKPGE